MKKIYSIMLALLFALTLAQPGFTVEASEPEPSPTPDAAETALPEPSESPLPQESELLGEISEETEPPMESRPQETDEIPASEETPGQEDASMPEGSEFPGDESPDDDPSVINVTVPKSGRVVINPYGLPVDTGIGISREQIVGEPMAITNLGGASVAVWASAVGSISDLSSADFVLEPPQKDAREKEIFLYAEFNDGESPWNDDYNNAENQILITDQVSEPKNVLTLDEGEDGWFQLFGSTAIYPEDDWCEDDVFHVTFTFTFRLDEVLNAAAETETAQDPEPTEEPAQDPEATEGPAQDLEPTEGPAQDLEATEGPAQDLEPTEEPEAEPTSEFTDGPTPDPDPETVDEPMLEPAPEGTD